MIVRPPSTPISYQKSLTGGSSLEESYAISPSRPMCSFRNVSASSLASTSPHFYPHSVLSVEILSILDERWASRVIRMVRRIGLATALALLGGGAARADVIFSNLEPGDNYEDR